MAAKREIDYFKLFDELGYIFKNKQHLERALTHRSASKNNNERLEYLGDSIINFCMADILFRNFPDQDEGTLTRMRSNLVKKETLVSIAKSINLTNYLILGTGELKSGGYLRDSILADTLEALCAAIYLDDENITTVKAILANLFSQKINAFTSELDSKDPKTLLQEYLQKYKLPLPIYVIEEITGAAHDQTFHVSCTVHIKDIPNKITHAESKNLRSAEQKAAKLFLDNYCHDNE